MLQVTALPLPFKCDIKLQKFELCGGRLVVDLVELILTFNVVIDALSRKPVLDIALSCVARNLFMYATEFIHLHLGNCGIGLFL